MSIATSTDAVAWIGAITGVLSLVCVIWLGIWQIRSARRAEERERLRSTPFQPMQVEFLRQDDAREVILAGPQFEAFQYLYVRVTNVGQGPVYIRDVRIVFEWDPKVGGDPVFVFETEHEDAKNLEANEGRLYRLALSDELINQFVGPHFERMNDEEWAREWVLEVRGHRGVLWSEREFSDLRHEAMIASTIRSYAERKEPTA